MTDVIILTHEYPPFRGGIATYTQQLASAASKLGHTVVVYAPSYGKEASQELVDGFRIEYFQGSEFRPRYFFKILKLTLEVILRHPGAIIHAADWPFVLSCSLMRRFTSFKLSVMLHGSEILFFKRSKIVNLITFGDPFYGAKTICVNSNYTGKLLTDNFSISITDIRLTYLGVDQFWFSQDYDFNNVFAQLKISPSNDILISVGRIHPRKGQLECIEALNRLPLKLRKNVVYIVAGKSADDDYFTQVEIAARDSDVKVIVTDKLDNADLKVIYQRSKLFTLAAEPHGTKVEGFGLVFLEAAASELPTVAFSSAAVPEVVLDGFTGLLAEHNNKPAFEQIIKLLLEDDERRKTLGKRARDWAAGFTWEKCAVATFDYPRLDL